MKSNITSNITNMPPNCKRAEEEMKKIMEEEDRQESQFKIANLPDSCTNKIHEFEQELNKQGVWNIALVAYQKTEA